MRVKTASGDRLQPRNSGPKVEVSSLVDVLLRRAAEQPNDPAYIFLPDRGGEPVSLTFADLYERARSVAFGLDARGQKGDRAVLLFPPGP